MSISTYAELKTAVDAYMHASSGLTAEIPDFIRAAEDMIAYGLDLPGRKIKPLRITDMEVRATASISTQYVAWPTDALTIRTIQINGTETRRLEYLTPEQIDRRTGGSTSGEPIMYTNIGREFQFAPTPDGTYTCEITYLKKYAAFSADADYNWLLTNHPFVYLYGALGHGFDFIMDTEHADRYYAKYASLIQGLNTSEEKAKYSGSSLRVLSK